MSPLAADREAFDAFAATLGIDPASAWFTPTENKMLILNAIGRLGDENYGHCHQPIPIGTTELAFRVMNTAETLTEAVELLQKFFLKVCPTRRLSTIPRETTFILRVDADGLDAEHGAACEMTSMLMYMFGLSAFVGQFLRPSRLYTRSEVYSSCMKYNKDADCEVVFGDFTGIELETSSLSLGRRSLEAMDPVSNAIRWGLLADKVRPIMKRNHLPLMNAEGLLKTVETRARQRNVDARQMRRIALKETDYTPRDLEKSIKAAKAMVLIATTNKTISEIGFELEFSDERSFRRFFSDVTGCTPLEYRMVYQEAAVSEGRNHFRAVMEAAKTLRL
jgi:AraC-like DNA-binding protein